MTSVSPSSSTFVPVKSTSAPSQRAADGAAAAAKVSAPSNETAKAEEQMAAEATAAKANTRALSQAEFASQMHELQVKMDKLNPALSFVVDQTSGRTVIQLTDRSTQEVIQQFPSAAAAQISKALDRFEKGLVVNKKV